MKMQSPPSLRVGVDLDGPGSVWFGALALMHRQQSMRRQKSRTPPCAHESPMAGIGWQRSGWRLDRWPAALRHLRQFPRRRSGWSATPRCLHNPKAH
jgi:hypothetical protein